MFSKRVNGKSQIKSESRVKMIAQLSLLILVLGLVLRVVRFALRFPNRVLYNSASTAGEPEL